MPLFEYIGSSAGREARVVNDVWAGSAGAHFEGFELNDARKKQRVL